MALSNLKKKKATRISLSSRLYTLYFVLLRCFSRVRNRPSQMSAPGQEVARTGSSCREEI